MLKRRIAILSLICRDFLASPYIDHDTKHQATRWWWITMRIEHFVRSSLYRISRTAFYAHWAMIKCLTFYLNYNCKRTTITNLTAQTTSRMLLMLKMPQVLLSGIKKSNVNKSHSDSSLSWIAEAFIGNCIADFQLNINIRNGCFDFEKSKHFGVSHDVPRKRGFWYRAFCETKFIIFTRKKKLENSNSWLINSIRLIVICQFVNLILFCISHHRVASNWNG